MLFEIVLLIFAWMAMILGGAGMFIWFEQGIARKASHWGVMQEYNRRHSVCPNCRSEEIAMTTSGKVFHDIESASDDNRANCETCGWKGIVHDLGPKATNSSVSYGDFHA